MREDGYYMFKIFALQLYKGTLMPHDVLYQLIQRWFNKGPNFNSWINE